MTSSRRSNDGPRLLVLLILACAVLAVVQLAEHLWPLMIAGLIAVVAWRGRRHLAALPRLADLRRQVAKLEQDATRYDELVGDLEDAAGRPVEAVIASYRHVQRQYRSVPQKTEKGV